MTTKSWDIEFSEIFNRGAHHWREGKRTPLSMFDPEDVNFLKSIGYTAQELFDFVDDYLRYGDPSPQTALEVATVRRRYFTEVMKGIASSHIGSMKDLPSKQSALGGIVWLPRIIKKAVLKLRGEMPEELMYGCAGDRSFLREINMSLAEFLLLVWETFGDEQKILLEVTKRKEKL